MVKPLYNLLKNKKADELVIWYVAFGICGILNIKVTLLVQPRKTCPCLTERLLVGRKESNQTNKKRQGQILPNAFKCGNFRKVDFLKTVNLRSKSIYLQLKSLIGFPSIIYGP